MSKCEFAAMRFDLYRRFVAACLLKNGGFTPHDEHWTSVEGFGGGRVTRWWPGGMHPRRSFRSFRFFELPT